MITESEILNAKILIVDDQESNINLLEQLLTDSAYNAFTSTMNPLEVVSLHQENHYDLILLDLQMPVMNGFEATAHIRNIMNLKSCYHSVTNCLCLRFIFTKS